jgi:hypothetical protein
MFYPPEDSVDQNGPWCFWAARFNFWIFEIFLEHMDLQEFKDMPIFKQFPKRTAIVVSV